MNTKTLAMAATLSLLVGFIAGCSQEKPAAPEPTSPPTVSTEAMPPPAPAATQPAEEIKAQVQTTVESAKTAATQTVQQVQGATQSAVNEATAVIKKAQDLFAEKKYSEALQSLQSLANVKLSPEQQQLVDSLKQKIQQAMATQAVPEGVKSIPNPLK